MDVGESAGMTSRPAMIVACSRSNGAAANHEIAWVTVALQHLSLLFNPCVQAGKALPVLWGVSA